MTENSVVVQIPGPHIRSQQNELIKELLVDHLQRGQHNLVLNFEGVEFVDSSFLGMMIVILKRATSVNGDLRICCLSPALSTIFSMMRLNRLFTIYQTVEDAQRSYDD